MKMNLRIILRKMNIEYYLKREEKVTDIQLGLEIPHLIITLEK